MKRKIADVGPRYNQEEAERLKAILRTRADDQFELDKLFSGNPNIRHQTRQKLERLLVQAEAAETMAPGLQRDMSKMASVTDEEAKILGLDKLASMSRQALPALQAQFKSGGPVSAELARRVAAHNLGREAGLAAGLMKHHKSKAMTELANPKKLGRAWKQPGDISMEKYRRLRSSAAEGIREGRAAKAGTHAGLEEHLSGLNKAASKNVRAMRKLLTLRHARTRPEMAQQARHWSHVDGQAAGKAPTLKKALAKITSGKGWKRDARSFEKNASIAPNVDAWFEKHASIPSPAIGAKAVRVTASARPGRVPAQSNLAGGSA